MISAATDGSLFRLATVLWHWKLNPFLECVMNKRSKSTQQWPTSQDTPSHCACYDCSEIFRTKLHSVEAPRNRFTACRWAVSLLVIRERTSFSSIKSPLVFDPRRVFPLLDNQCDGHGQSKCGGVPGNFQSHPMSRPGKKENSKNTNKSKFLHVLLIEQNVVAIIP